MYMFEIIFEIKILNHIFVQSLGMLNKILKLIPGLKVALVQLSVGPDKAKNIAAAVKEIHEAKNKGAQLVALPECFNSPYGTS